MAKEHVRGPVMSVEEFKKKWADPKNRHELKKLTGHLGLGDGLVDALSEMDVNEIVSITGWQNALLIAIFDLPLSQIERVLNSWLSKWTGHLSFIDFALYKIVRSLPKGNETRNRWIANCADLSLDTKNFSLTESLILVLREDALNYPDIIAIAEGYAKTSAQMRRVLRNACKLNVTEEF